MATYPVTRSGYDLGRAVRAARLALGLSQAELARDAHVGRQWLVEFELGDKGSAPIDMVLRLLKALDLTVELAPPVTQPLPPAPLISASEIVRRHTQVL